MTTVSTTIRLASAVVGALALFAPPANGQTARDGSHDFDFARGVWRTHITRVLDPFEGGTHTVTSEGTKIARPLAGGRGWIEEIDADGGDGHWQGATLFLYNPKAGQWSQSYIDIGSAEVQPPEIGEFTNGRAEFYSTEKYQGRDVLVRGVWSDITANSHRYEIFYSRDGGRTWAGVFKAYLTRQK